MSSAYLPASHALIEQSGGTFLHARQPSLNEVSPSRIARFISLRFTALDGSLPTSNVDHASPKHSPPIAKAIRTATEQLAKMPASPDVLALKNAIQAVEEELDGWTIGPPATDQRERMSERWVLRGLDVNVTNITVGITMATRKRSARRPGRTKNVSVSLDETILKMLRERADSTHAGNLSAAIAEAAEVLHRQAARDEVARELMKGHPPLSDEERAKIDVELEEGWRHARRHAKKREHAA